jgi:hypothetical protein
MMPYTTRHVSSLDRLEGCDDPTCLAKISFTEMFRGDGFATHDDNFPRSSLRWLPQYIAAAGAGWFLAAKAFSREGLLRN